MFNSKSNNVDNNQFQELISRFDKLESKVDKLESKVDTNIDALDKRISQTTTLMLFFNGTAMLTLISAIVAVVFNYYSK